MTTSVIRIREMTSLFLGKLHNCFHDLLSLHITQWFVVLFLIGCTDMWCRFKWPLGHDAHSLELLAKGPELV